MAVSILNANWTANWGGGLAHASTEGYASYWGGRGSENANRGYAPDRAFSGWYYQELANYVALHGAEATEQAYGLKDGVDYTVGADGTVTVTTPTGVTYTGSADGQTGHFEGILDSGVSLTGAGYNGNKFAVQQFGAREYVSCDGYGNLSARSYTVEEYRALLDEAVKNGITVETPEGEGLKGQIAALEAELAELNAQLGDARATQAEASSALATAQGAQAAAQQELDAMDERPTSERLQQAVDEAQRALDAAKDAQQTAGARYESVKGSVDAALKELGAQKDAASTALADAQARLSGLASDRDTAQAELTGANALLASLNGAALGYHAALDGRDVAARSLADAQGALDTLAAEVERLGGEVADATADHEAKQGAADAAGATAEQEQAVARTKAALDAAEQQFGALTAARDTARDGAAAAQGELAAAQGRLDALIEDEAGLERRIAALADVAAENGARAAAWERLLAAQEPGDIVLNGIDDGVLGDTGAEAAVAAQAAGAHDRHAATLDEIARAQAALDAARGAYDAAVADDAATQRELVEKLADLAMAQDAHDRLIARFAPGDGGAPEAGAGTVRQASMEMAAPAGGMPQTGDASQLAALGFAGAGVAVLAAGAVASRKRREA